MTSTGTDHLLRLWRDEEAVVPSGWDFSSLAGRVHEDEVPWDFVAETRRLLGSASRVLDMGTGGGEHLTSLADALPSDTTATEGWAPNLPVARRALAPLGIDVVAYDAEAVPAEPMPFDDGRFDLVLARHEAFDAVEVARVLAPGGVLLTQQVGGDDAAEAHELFGAPFAYPDMLLPVVTASVEAAGLEVEESASWSGETRFDDVGALVRYFRMVPWDVPGDFGVDRYADVLLDLHRAGPARGEPFVLTQTRFWVRASKPR